MYVIKIKCNENVFVNGSDCILFGCIISYNTIIGAALGLDGKIITYQSGHCGHYTTFPTQVIARLNKNKIRPVVKKWLGQYFSVDFELLVLKESDIRKT